MLDSQTVRIGGKDWTQDEIRAVRHQLDNTKLLVKEIAAIHNVGPRTLTRPDVRRKLGVRASRPRHGGNNTRGRLPIPKNVHPLVRRLFELLNHERATAKEISKRAGLCVPAVSLWRKQMPRLDNFSAALNALGYKLRIVAKGEDE